MASTNDRASTSDYEPAPRAGHALVVFKSKIYLIGGLGTNGEAISLSSLEMFDPTTLKWQCCKTMGANIPMEICATAYAISKDVLYLFGGYLRGRFVNSFVKLDMESLEWSSISQRNVPEPRKYASMIVDGEDNLLLYGGVGDNGRIFNDLHIFFIKYSE